MFKEIEHDLPDTHEVMLKSFQENNQYMKILKSKLKKKEKKLGIKRQLKLANKKRLDNANR